MPYTKHNWVNGETITDTLLNHIEDGIDNSSPLVVFVTKETQDENNVYTMNKTWNEIYNAMASGKSVIVRYINTLIGTGVTVTVYYDYLIDTISPAMPEVPFMDNYYHVYINQIEGGSSASFEIHDFKCADPDSNPTHSQLA